MTYIELIDTTPFVEVIIGLILIAVLITTMDFIGLGEFASKLTVLMGSILLMIISFFVLTSLGFLT